MSKQSLLLVDGDVRSMRVLEVSLRKAGFTVTTATSVQDGLDKLEVHAPDLIISETTFPDGDGFELRRRVRSAPDWSEIPFIFLTAEAAIENKIKGLELGVDDYLTKPIYIKEIVTRINILLQKRQRARFEERRDGRTRFAGRVSDMPVVDVIQTIEVSRKSGVIQFVGDRGRQATIYFRDGNVIDAESGTLQGEDAVYRLLTWSEGEFEVVFRTVRRRRVIETSSQGLLMEGMRRLDEWSRLLEQLPPVTHRFEVDAGELARRLGDVPDDNNGILRLIDGKRTLLEVIDASDVGDLECLQAISRLYFEDMLIDLDHDAPARRDTGKPMPLVEVESSSPIAVAATADSGEHEALAPAPAVAAVAGDEDTEDETEPDPEETEPPEEAPSPEPGELMGGYRPSSLRLIDEAVAAAQAIEPSLFDEAPVPRPGSPEVAAEAASAPGAGREATPGRPSARDEGFSSFGSEEPTQPSPLRAMAMAVPKEAAEEDSVPQEISADEPPTPRRPPRTTQPSNPPPRRNEDSGLRMIGSHGRDRAEASGELGVMPRTISRPPVEERELVTILPRRTTREVPVQAAPGDPAKAPSSGDPAKAPAPATPTEPPYPSVRLPVVGTGTSVAKATAAEEPRRDLAPGGEVHEGQGPGAVAKLLFVIAALLIGVTVYLWVRDREPGTTDARPPEEPLIVMTPDGIDGGVADGSAGDGERPAMAGDGGIVAAVDAGGPPHDASPLDQSKLLREQADAALQEGDAETALQLAEQSIRLRRTARAFLVKAQALQRLSRFEEAFDATHDAEEQAPTFPAVFEIRGAILWQQDRIEEAKEEYRRFLELEPNGEKAARVRRRIGD